MVMPNSFHLQCHITDRCNFTCRHCYMGTEKGDMRVDDFKVLISQYADLVRAWGLKKGDRPSTLSIGGGEPFMNRNFFDFLDIVRENRSVFSSVGIMSNGSMISKGIASSLKDYGVSGVQVSLEGTENVNDGIRGKGSFKKAFKGILNLLDAGIPTGVAVTISRENHEDFPRLLALLEESGVKSVGVSRFVPIGRDGRIRMLTPLQTREFYGKIMALKKSRKKNGIRINTHCSDSIWFIEDQAHVTHGCSAGFDSFSVLPDGNVVPCRRLPVVAGNFLKKSLFDIWYTSDFLWKLRNKGRISACTSCELFEKCFGGARCVANGYFKKTFAPDPQCWKLFDKLPEKTAYGHEVNGFFGCDNSLLRKFDRSKYFGKALNV